jgi:putative PIN family toxin of toxin-antitoxin system
VVTIVLDTNVVFARYANISGAPARIFGFIEQRSIELIVSQAILDEYDDVLARPKMRIDYGLTDQDGRIALATIGRLATFVTPTIRLNAVPDDPSDNKFVEAAVAGSADFIVSGDKHLLALGDHRAIRVTPASFVTYVASQRNE